MEQPPSTDTNPPEMPPPSLGEAMSKLLESIDPQGLLNEAYQEDGPTDDGVDRNKKGDEHAGQHVVSLSHSGSDSGSGSGDESGEPAAQNSKMEVEPPSYRIVDIEPPVMQLAALQNPAIPAPTPDGSADPAASPSPAMIPAMIPAMNPALDAAHNHNFAVPADPTTMRFKNIPGMNIFQVAGAENTVEKKIQNNPNSARNPDPNASDSAAGLINPNLNKVPSGVKKPNFANPLPPKKPDPIEPDAVPSRSYEAIIKNKKRRRKRAPLVASLPARAPRIVVVFLTKVTTGC